MEKFSNHISSNPIYRQILDQSRVIFLMVTFASAMTGCELLNNFLGVEEESESTPAESTDGSSPPAAAAPVTNPTYQVYVELSGLEGDMVALWNNGSDPLVLNNDGRGSFPTNLANGEAYLVTIASDPQDPDQICTVSDGEGVIDGGDVTDITVNCVAACTESHEILQSSYNQSRAAVGPTDVINKVCQSFSIIQDTTLENVSIYMRRKTAGTTTGTVTVYTDNGTNDCEGGSVIAQSNSPTWSSTVSWVKFDFVTTPDLVAGNYRMVLDPDADSYVYADDRDPYANGCEYLQLFTGTWNTTAGPCNWDVAFRVNSTLCD